MWKLRRWGQVGRCTWAIVDAVVSAYAEIYASLRESYGAASCIYIQKKAKLV